MLHKEMMRVVFIGASHFGLRCLKYVMPLSEIEVVGIVTNREHFAISYNPSGVRNVLYADFGPFAKQCNIPLVIMKRTMTEGTLVSTIKSWNPDFILVVGWYHMIPRAIRNLAPVAGIHASLLPDYSGGAPLVWAMINGEEKTGVTFFMFEDGVDSGDIIAQTEEPIYFEDTIATLYARIEKAGVQLLQEFLPRIAVGTVTYTPQDENKRRIMPQRSPEDGEIDWTWTVFRIYNFIRAQTKPYPGAFTYFQQEKLIIWESSLPDMSAHPPSVSGEVMRNIPDAPEAFGVWGGDNRLLLVNKVGLQDGTTVSGAEWVAIRKIGNSAILGKP